MGDQVFTKRDHTQIKKNETFRRSRRRRCCPASWYPGYANDASSSSHASYGWYEPIVDDVPLGDDSAMDSDLLMLMMMGGQGMGQMNPLMLSMLLDSEPDYDRTKLEKICDDAGVDCTAHLEAIFQPIETDKPKDCTGDDACAKAVKDAYDAIMKNKKSDMSDLLLLSMLGGQGMGDMNSCSHFSS